MDCLNAKTIKERLPKKGIIESDYGDCWHLKKSPSIQISLKTINNISSYDDSARDDIAKSLYLNLEEFQKLIECTISKDKYYNKYIKPRLI